MNNPFEFNTEEILHEVKEIRKNVLKMNHGAGQGHTGADLSEADILASLYFRLLRYTKENPRDPQRDRFILSKGHGVGGFYCTLMQAGLLDKNLLGTYLEFDSKLPGHPVRQKNDFVEVNTGALGHGLPIGVGMAIAAKKQNLDYKVYVLTGDGELQEGSNWEAAMTASHYKLDNLIWIIDRNNLQLADFTENIVALEPLGQKLEAFGMEYLEINGNDPGAIISTIESLAPNGKPKAILARTTKGCGVSFIENQPSWHHKVPTDEELSRAMEELSC
ncbi:transketolase [Desulfopila aestuarii]|uniref:Transketolase subunit A n=1 Tax=Desulfopila aestuarii DSM 18488 TaxID=1121416 RepID=A0A1M7XVU2_9BACT|nr:transketolase [Desulfopila aestuarii]SHO42810.1 transketolase subunit A [Desulfopila aestuarii DSM 18488]